MLSLVLFLVLIQFSMALFIVIRGRKEKSLRQAFYTLFVSVTFAECLGVLLTQLSDAVEEMSSSTIDTYLAVFLATVGNALQYPVLACRNYQPLCHAVISINRLTAFAFPFRHSNMWSRRTVIVALAAMCLTATAFTAFAPVYRATTATKRQDILPTWTVHGEESVPAVTELIRSLNLVLTSAVSFAINLTTVIMFVVYRKSAASNKQQQTQRRQDVRLFVYIVYMLLVQVVLAFVLFVHTTEYFLIHWDVKTEPEIAWLPRWLRLLRLDSKKWLVGDPNCSHSMPLANDYYGVEYEQAYCGVLYTLLHPELFRSLNVKSFMEDLYNLSSTPFLLLVSGTIRKAYLEFYGDAILGCFQRSQRKRVVTITTSSSITRS